MIAIWIRAEVAEEGQLVLDSGIERDVDGVEVPAEQHGGDQREEGEVERPGSGSTRYQSAIARARAATRTRPVH